MGFFDKLFGAPSRSSEASGFSALSPELRSQFTPFASEIRNLTLPSAGGGERFTPMAQTSDEARAFDILRGGFAPTSETISSDIAMQMNPYEQSVIDEINRQSGGEFSILKQAMSEAGQLGSNRGLTGASDIEERRLGQIGRFKGEQFNKALQNALTTLPAARAGDVQGLLGIGEFQRALDLATKQAPIQALGAGTSLMSPFLTGGTSTSRGATGGILGDIGKIAGAGLAGMGASAGGAGLGTSLLTGLAAFSTKKLKENIIKVGEKNGFNIYNFNYKHEPDVTYQGVIAEEVEKIKPEAVTTINGHKAVYYDKIGIEFKRL